MDGPRPPFAGEYDNLLRFLNTNLRAKSHWSIAEEYPMALSTQNLHNIRIIEEKGQILSHAVLKPTIVKTNIGVFKVGALGSVVTDEKYRNQGLSQKTLEDCLGLAREQGCDFAILWTNLFEFYRKFGFELAGTEISFIVDREIAVPQGNYRFLMGTQLDPEALLRLYSQHTVSSIRTFDEVKRYLKIPNSNVYTAWGPDGQMAAYIVEGKGMDLQGYVHEWGGSMAALLPLVNFALRDQKRGLTWIIPGHSQNLIRRLEEQKFRGVQGFLGMIKILNPSVLFGKVLRVIKADLGEIDFVLEQRSDRHYYIGTRSNLFKTDSESDIVRLLFGPQKAREIHSFDPRTLTLLEKCLPIPMWLWGWDSV